MGMRSGLAVAALVFVLAGPASAQSLPPAQPVLRGGDAGAGGTLRPSPFDPAVEAQRTAGEARLKRRENDAKRTLRSICRGC